MSSERMMEKSMKKMLFIMNPFAGQKRANRVLPDILLQFSEAGFEINTVMTTGTGAATRAAQKSGQDVDIVVCCGGDGTLNETITGLLRAGARCVRRAAGALGREYDGRPGRAHRG